MGLLVNLFALFYVLQVVACDQILSRDHVVQVRNGDNRLRQIRSNRDKASPYCISYIGNSSKN